MIKNKDINNTSDGHCYHGQSHHFENRLEEERRREPNEGFVYVSIAGWIDRRETIRRKDDPFNL
ncbi:MAG: hypothetical protein PVI60_11715 [Desulfobacteraceae bacterium]|jgi:hypothetical protein